MNESTNDKPSARWFTVRRDDLERALLPAAAVYKRFVPRRMSAAGIYGESAGDYEGRFVGLAVHAQDEVLVVFGAERRLWFELPLVAESAGWGDGRVAVLVRRAALSALLKKTKGAGGVTFRVESSGGTNRLFVDSSGGGTDGRPENPRAKTPPESIRVDDSDWELETYDKSAVVRELDIDGSDESGEISVSLQDLLLAEAKLASTAEGDNRLFHGVLLNLRPSHGTPEFVATDGASMVAMRCYSAGGDLELFAGGEGKPKGLVFSPVMLRCLKAEAGKRPRPLDRVVFKFARVARKDFSTEVVAEYGRLRLMLDDDFGVRSDFINYERVLPHRDVEGSAKDIGERHFKQVFDAADFAALVGPLSRETGYKSMSYHHKLSLSYFDSSDGAGMETRLLSWSKPVWVKPDDPDWTALSDEERAFARGDYKPRAEWGITEERRRELRDAYDILDGAKDGMPRRRRVPRVSKRGLRAGPGSDAPRGTFYKHAERGDLYAPFKLRRVAEAAFAGEDDGAGGGTEFWFGKAGHRMPGGGEDKGSGPLYVRRRATPGRPEVEALLMPLASSGDPKLWVESAEKNWRRRDGEES